MSFILENLELKDIQFYPLLLWMRPVKNLNLLFQICLTDPRLCRWSIVKVEPMITITIIITVSLKQHLHPYY